MALDGHIVVTTEQLRTQETVYRQNRNGGRDVPEIPGTYQRPARDGWCI